MDKPEISDIENETIHDVNEAIQEPPAEIEEEVMKNANEGTGKPISGALKKFFGVGDFGFAMMANIDTFYASYFFINIAQFSLVATSVITTISAVVDMFLSTLYGPFMNKVKPRKWGRYRSWLVLTPWMVPILYAAQFVRLGNGVAALAFCTIAMITSRIAWNLPFISNISMINKAGATQKDRMSLSSSRAMWGSAASVVYSYAGPAVVSVFAALIGGENAYAATAFAFSCLMVAGMYAHFVMFKGYELTGPEEIALLQKQASESGEEKVKVKVLKVLTSSASLVWLFISNITKYVAMFLVNGIAIYYFTYVSFNPGMLATFVLISNLLAIIAGYLSRFIVDKFGAKATVVASLLVSSIVGVVGYLLFQNLLVAMITMSAFTFMLRLTNACDPELYAKCARFIGNKLGYDVTGTVMGLLTVPLKIGIVFRGILISVVLGIAGFDAAIDPSLADAALQSGVSIGFMIIPAVVAIFGAIALAFGYRLTREDVK